MFYRMDSDLFETSGEHDTTENLTSGEIEPPLYIRHDGKYYLGIGSDHTDRDIEARDIGDSKRACPKPVSNEVIAVESLKDLDLDECTARSWVDGALYQEGSLSGSSSRPTSSSAFSHEPTSATLISCAWEARFRC